MVLDGNPFLVRGGDGIYCRLLDSGWQVKNLLRAKGITPDEFATIFANNGRSNRRTGESLGVSESCIHGWVKRLGIEARRINKPLLERFSAEYLRGVYAQNNRNSRATARELGVSCASLRDWARRDGLPAAYSRCKTDKETIEELYIRQRLTMAEVATKCGVSVSAICARIQKFNLQVSREEATHRTVRTKMALGKTPGRHVTVDGYVKVYDPNSGLFSQTEHRSAVEQFIGRKLLPGEKVHHINLNRSDNRIENLALLSSTSEHGVVHGYYQKVAVWCLGIAPAPEPLIFSGPRMWGGKWITELSLLGSVQEGRCLSMDR